MDDLEVGERGLTARAPGDQPLATVDEALVVEALEDVAHRAQGPGSMVKTKRVQSAGAQDHHLLADAAAVLVHELPDPLQELLAAEIVPGQPLFGQLLFDDPLAGDASVIRAGNPEVGSPSMRCQRIMMSSTATNRAWPMCSSPVTFGGGMTTTNGWDPVARAAGNSRRRPSDRRRRFRPGGGHRLWQELIPPGLAASAMVIGLSLR